jgi:hypothetical protein
LVGAACILTAWAQYQPSKEYVYAGDRLIAVVDPGVLAPISLQAGGALRIDLAADCTVGFAEKDGQRGRVKSFLLQKPLRWVTPFRRRKLITFTTGV